MNINKQESEVLKIFTQNPEQFPKINECINTQAPVSGVTAQLNNNEETSMEVIWAGKLDEQNNSIICQMIAQDSSIANSCLAKVIDKSGHTVAEKSFVSFDRNMAFAILSIPQNIFADCSVQMDMAMMGVSGCKVVTDTIPLDTFDAEEVDVDYEICAPVINRKGSYDRISVSYYKYSPKDNYDYVYPGRGENQMYFPSSGKLNVKNIELKSADMKLRISDGSKGAYYPITPDIKVKDSVITYDFEPKWSGTKLDECFDFSKGYNTKAEYILEIMAVKKDDGSHLTFLITNIDGITIVEKDASSIKRIQPIDVYLDCFAEGTEIRMADGSIKPVESIQAGDMIKTKDGSKTAVKEVQVQEDCQVLTLSLQSGRELSLTAGHAVYTEDGVYPASRLKENQMVITDDGKDKITRIIPQCERTYRVYALFLEGSEEWLYANSVMVHSSDSGDVFKDRDWVREDLPEEWRFDYDNAIKAGIVYGRS